MPHDRQAPPARTRARVAVALVGLIAVSTAVGAGMHGLADFVPEACDSSGCEGIAAVVETRSDVYGDAHEDIIAEISEASEEPLITGEAPTVSCLGHSQDADACTPASLDVRDAEEREDGILFVVEVEKEDVATEVLGPADLDNVTTPTQPDEERDISLPPLREGVELSVRIQHEADAHDETISIAEPNGMDRGTGIHEWRFNGEHLSAPRIAGTYLITFIAASDQGAAQTDPAIVNVISHAPPQLQPAGTTSDLLEGGSQEYTLQLAGDPGERQVTWDLSSSSPRMTFSATRITLDQHDAPVTVTLTAPDDDDVALGDETITIHHTFRPALSTWDDWVLDDFTTTLQLRDDDAAGIELTTPSGTLHLLEGSSRKATVQLASQPQSDVTIAMAMGSTAGTSVEPEELEFTPDDWMDPQEVTVRVSSDAELSNIRQFALTARVAPDSESSPEYAFASAILPVMAVDPETVLLRTTGAQISIPPEGPGQEVRITPLVRPEGPVEIRVRSSDDAVVAVPSRLVFTPSNWTVEQAVFLRLVPEDVEPGPLATVSFEISEESSLPYGGTKDLLLDVDAPAPPAPPVQEEQAPVVTLAAPSDLTAARVGQEVTLTWRAAPDTDTPAYAVWRFPGQVAEIVQAAPGEMQSHVELMPGHVHRYAVQAVSGSSLQEFDEDLATEWAVVARPGAVEQTCEGKADADQDGLCDAFETIIMTSATKADTDGDGSSDSVEYHAGTDPLKADSFPVSEDESSDAMSAAKVYGISATAAALVLGAAAGVALLMRRNGAKHLEQ